MERANPDISGRPVLVRGNRQLLFGGMKRLPPFAAVNALNKSMALTAEVVVPEAGAEGVIFAMGGLTGGYSLYARGGKLKYCYNFFGLKHYFVESAERIPPGKRQVRGEFAYDGGGLGKGGTMTLFIDGRKAGEGRIEMTEPFGFSADETMDVGMEAGSPVSPDYGPRGNAFTGEVHWVEIDVDKDALDEDHFLTGAERFRVAMAFQ
jgi:arylsulfatase